MSKRYALGLGAVGLVFLACGGSVSLGDTKQGVDGENGEPTGEAKGVPLDGGKKDCTAQGACGPAPGMPAFQCSDGSFGGNTGRCLETAEGGCNWEIRACPDGGAPSNLKWYSTCGAPICKSPEDAGAPVVCATQGTPCSSKGATCGNPDLNCGSVMVCDDHDPKGGVGGCPISTKKAKDGITYVDDAELARLHDETLRMKLATYRYKGPFVDPNDPSAKHLGFIIEDQPQSMSVDRGHDRVDLYGYMSMAVATIQVQDKQLSAQQKRIDALEKELAALKKTRPR